MLCLWHKWEYVMVVDHKAMARYMGRRCRCGRKEILQINGVETKIEQGNHNEAVTPMIWKKAEG